MCVYHQPAYADNCADAVDRLLMPYLYYCSCTCKVKCFNKSLSNIYCIGNKDINKEELCIHSQNLFNKNGSGCTVALELLGWKLHVCINI